jgi:hypothetical protein
MISTKKTVFAAVLAAAAIAAPSASAIPTDSNAAKVIVPAGVNAGLGPSNGEAAPDVANPTADQSVPNSFDWGDAGIGAAGMLSLLGIGAGAVVLTRRGRRSDPVVG